MPGRRTGGGAQRFGELFPAVPVLLRICHPGQVEGDAEVPQRRLHAPDQEIALIGVRQAVSDYTLCRHALRQESHRHIAAVLEKHRYKATCMMTPQYDYTDDNLPDGRQLAYYLKTLAVPWLLRHSMIG